MTTTTKLDTMRYGSPAISFKKGTTALPRDSLRVTNVSLSMSYPPTIHYNQSTFPDLYAELAKRHRFETVQLEGEKRATFETEGFRSCSLDGSNLSLDEEVQRDFALVKRDFGDILTTIKEGLSIPLFFGPDVRMRARWEVSGEQDVMQIMQDRVIKLNDDQLKLLKLDELETLGFQVHGDRDHVHHIIEISPSGSDPSQLILEIRCHYHTAIQTVQIAEQRMQETYDFLVERVAAFVESFTDG